MKENEVKEVQRSHTQGFSKNYENLKPQIQNLYKTLSKKITKKIYLCIYVICIYMSYVFVICVNTYVIVKPMKTKHQKVKSKKQPEEKKTLPSNEKQ